MPVSADQTETTHDRRQRRPVQVARSSAHIQDRLTTAERVRALLELCREDLDLWPARVEAKASDASSERKPTPKLESTRGPA